MSMIKGLLGIQLNAQKLFGVVLGSSVVGSKPFYTKHLCTEASLDEEEKTQETSNTKSRPQHDVETSIRYLKSDGKKDMYKLTDPIILNILAYEKTYRGAKVWEPYKRNHKGAFAPSKTRKTCLRQGVLATGNPCPICRDEYLVLHPKNTHLLEQFISPFTGEVLSYTKTGVCQKQHKNLLIAVEQAWDLGYIKMPLPNRMYDYSLYKNSSK